MVKALPLTKTSVEQIRCQECGVWYKESDCRYETLVAVNSDDHLFTSDYDGCDYYSDYSTKDVWKCPNGCWIWDPNDGDVDTPERSTDILWQCNNCNVTYPSKDRADACCA